MAASPTTSCPGSDVFTFDSDVCIVELVDDDNPAGGAGLPESEVALRRVDHLERLPGSAKLQRFVA